MSGLRRVEVVRPHWGDRWMEVCAEGDCEDEELLAFANAEWGGGWGVVMHGSAAPFKPEPCVYDRRRTHFVLAREEPNGCC